MKKYILYSFIAMIAAGLVSGCLPKKASEALVYSGPTVAEIKNQNLGQSQANVLTKLGIYTTTQTDSSRTVLLASRGIDSILVQLVGPQRSVATDLAFTVRPTNATYTAIEGTNYSFIPTGTRIVTIPANSSSAYIRVNMITGSIPATETSRTLAIDLQGSTDVPANPNYNRFILTLRR